MIDPTSDLRAQLVTVTNELIAAHRNLAECHVAERSTAATTYSAGTWASVAAADRAIEVACSGIRNDISRYVGLIAGLDAARRSLETLLLTDP